MATHTNVPGMNPSSVDFRLATVQIARGSTNEQQEIIVLGDPNSSVGLAQVLASAPTSTAHGLVVRIAGGASTATDFAVRALLSSTSADNPVTIQSPSTGIPVNIVNASASDNDTGVMAGGKSSVTVVLSESFGWDGSTNWTKVQASTAAPAVGANGWAVRPVMPTLNSTCSTSAFSASTAWTVVTSNAATKGKVYAYSITTTCVTATQLMFYDGSTPKWPVVLQAISSAISGANLAVSPPASLFSGSTGAPLTLNNGTGSSGGPAFHVAVSFFSEP